VKNFERRATSGWVQQVIAGDVWLFPSLVVVVVVPPSSPRDSLSVLLCSRDDAPRRARTRIQCVPPQRVSRQSRNPKQRLFKILIEDDPIHDEVARRLFY